jgi:pimeloyl-ACP methyl ester carboxylesterase
VLSLSSSIDAGDSALQGDVNLPEAAQGLVIFAHGSGSGRLSPRNRQVAETLNERGLATLLLDLLTEAEAADRRKVFDVGLLAERLLAATEWTAGQSALATLGRGYFGASTGAAAALIAAAERPEAVRAVVSRGGRPDLAGPRLAQVRAPTLLIVGGADLEVLRLNREARERLRVQAELAVIGGATHLFEEPGALEQVAELSSRWFAEHLGPGSAPAKVLDRTT